MPRDTEADRIMHQRRLQHEAQQKANLNATKRQRKGEIQRRADELAIEIPAVLRLLAERGYPGMQDVDCSERIPILGGLLGHRTRRSHKAAWLLGTSERDGETLRDYLFSDGRVSVGRDMPAWPTQLQELVERDFHLIDSGYFRHQGEDFISRITDGLDNLRRRLEGGS